MGSCEPRSRGRFVAFEIVHGEIPDFIDGHQHVHVLPVIRLALLAVLTERGYQGRLWLRDPSEPFALSRDDLSGGRRP